MARSLLVAGVVGRSAASFRMTPAHEPSRSVTPQPDARAGPLAGTLGAAAVTPGRGQDGLESFVTRAVVEELGEPPRHEAVVLIVLVHPEGS